MKLSTLVVVVACGRQSSAPPPPAPMPAVVSVVPPASVAPPPTTVASPVTAGGRVGCISEADLVKLALTWGKRLEHPKCVALLQGNTTVWLLDGALSMPDTTRHERLLVTPEGTLLDSTSEEYGAGEQDYTRDWQVADLDGDGREETIAIQHEGRQGFYPSSLHVGTIVANKLVEAPPVDYAFDGDDGTCVSTFALQPGVGGIKILVVDTKRVSGKGGECPPIGIRRFVWKATALELLP